ncbi:hypothetical protein EIN_100810, partial [Entamoeba invadens IP1]
MSKPQRNPASKKLDLSVLRHSTKSGCGCDFLDFCETHATEIMECLTLQQQMKLLRSEKWLEKVSIETKAKVLGVSPSTARLNNLYDDVEGKSGRKREINQSRMPLLLETIRERQNTTKPITTKEMGNVVEGVVGKKVSKRTIANSLRREGLIKKIAKPMDKERAELSKDELRSYETRAVDLLNNDKQYAGERVVHLNGVKPSLLINMDESGYCSFVDSKRSNFYVDDNYDYTNSYSVDRSQKRITLIAGIFANNTTLKPMIILSN